MKSFWLFIGAFVYEALAQSHARAHMLEYHDLAIV
jgi:hypothetical protein